MNSTTTRLLVSVRNRYTELRTGSERGLTTTEVAVLTFILVGIAVVIGGLLLSKARQPLIELDTIPVIEAEDGV